MRTGPKYGVPNEAAVVFEWVALCEGATITMLLFRAENQFR